MAITHPFLARTIGVKDLRFSEIDSAYDNCIKGRGTSTEIRASGMLLTTAWELNERFYVDSDILTGAGYSLFSPPNPFSSGSFNVSFGSWYLGIGSGPNNDWLDSTADDGFQVGDIDKSGGPTSDDWEAFQALTTTTPSPGPSTDDTEIANLIRFQKLFGGNGTVRYPGLTEFKLSSLKGTNLHHNRFISNPEDDGSAGQFREFGQATAVGRLYLGGSYDADYFLVGDPYAEPTGLYQSGAAYSYDGGGILRVTYTSPTPTASNNYGNFLDADSDIIAISDFKYNSNQGRVYTYQPGSSTVLNTFTGAASSLFGHGIAIDQDVLYVIAKAANAGTYGTGTLYAYNARSAASLWSVNYPYRNTNLYPGVTHFLGNNAGAQEGWPAIAAKNGYVAVAGGFNDSTGGKGKVWVYNKAGTLQYELNSSDAGIAESDGNHFGARMVIYKDYLVISHFDGNINNYACIFTLSTGAFVRKISNPDPDTKDTGGDRFSSALAAGNNLLFIGAHLDEEEDDAGSYGGSVYVYSFDGTLQKTITKDSINNAGADDANDVQFGQSIAANDRLAVFGAVDYDSDNSSANGIWGACILYDPRHILDL